jgi:hypothetical protein
MVRIALSAMIAFASAAANQPADSDGAFPLRSGTTWIYSGTVAGSIPVRTVMTIVEVIDRGGNLTAARVHGMPFGLMQQSNDMGEHLLIRSGMRRFYLVEPPRSAEALARLRNLQDGLSGLLHDSELLLDLPLIDGQRICENAQIASAHGHCWVVTGGTQADSATRGSEYALTWRGLTGHKTVRFVPGVGITGFAFEHGPSRAAASVRLIEHRPGRD